MLEDPEATGSLPCTQAAHLTTGAALSQTQRLRTTQTFKRGRRGDPGVMRRWWSASWECSVSLGSISTNDTPSLCASVSKDAAWPAIGPGRATFAILQLYQPHMRAWSLRNPVGEARVSGDQRAHGCCRNRFLLSRSRRAQASSARVVSGSSNQCRWRAWSSESCSPSVRDSRCHPAPSSNGATDTRRLFLASRLARDDFPVEDSMQQY